jgi:hypothetical protein
VTLKHQNETLETPKIAKNRKKFTCKCGNLYNSRTTLWRHKKVCLNEKMEEDQIMINPTESINKDDLINYLMKENSEMKNLVLEVCQKIQPANITNTINTVNTNSHNKTFNLNVFLNEDCKNAMNIMEFVDSLKIQFSDMENVGKLGFVDGISNIIVKNLKEMDIHKRPVHCSDSKREIVYIKDEDKWEKENKDKDKLRKVIKHIAHKNSKMLTEFKEKYPDCIYSDSKKSDQYNKLIIEAMGGHGDNNQEKENKILKKIVKEVIIEKETRV